MVKIKYIILIAVIAGLGSFIYTSTFVEEKFTSSSKFLVLMETTQNKTSELAFAQDSISSYMAIFKARDFFNEIVDKYNEGSEEELTSSQLMSITNIQASTNKDEATFTIRVTTTDPDKSYEITKLVSEYAVEKVDGIETLNSIMMVESPIKSFVPSSPNVPKNTFLGFLAGFILTAAFFVIKEILDGRVKNVEDIKLLCNIPILGVVPDNSNDAKKTTTSKDNVKEEF